MNVIQLEYFRAVMECGSVTEAARKLCVTQPAVSKQLRLLEEEFECGLFLREKNRLVPTPAADFLAGKLQALLPGFHSIPVEMNAFLERVAGKLRIGCGPFASAFVLPDLIVELLRRYPGIEPEISEKDSFFRDLEDGSLDIMVGVHKHTSKFFRYAPMISGAMMLVVSVDSPLAKAGKVTRRLLAAQPYLSYSFDPIRSDVFRKMPFLAQNRFVVESRYAQTLLAYVQRNLGFAIMPKYSLRDLPDRVVCLDYDTGLTSENGYLISTRRPMPPALQAMTALIEEKYRMNS